MIKKPIHCNKTNENAFIYYNEIPAPTFDNPYNYIEGLVNGCSVQGIKNNICAECELNKK